VTLGIYMVPGSVISVVQMLNCECAGCYLL